MGAQRINIVWLKRDLRLQDHEPLYMAEKIGLPYFILYFFEPTLMDRKDHSLRHSQFVWHSLKVMNKELQPYKRKVEILHGEAPFLFHRICQNYNVQQLFSYQESGTEQTWERDKKVKQIALENGVNWTEFQQNGVLRGIKDRKNWDEKWEAFMQKKPRKNTYSKGNISSNLDFPLPGKLLQAFEKYPSSLQPAGAHYAKKYLTSFFKDRGKNYARHISKPKESRTSCSRLSPYISWGNISIRQIIHFLQNHPNTGRNRRAIAAFATRLKWLPFYSKV